MTFLPNSSCGACEDLPRLKVAKRVRMDDIIRCSLCGAGWRTKDHGKSWYVMGVFELGRLRRQGRLWW